MNQKERTFGKKLKSRGAQQFLVIITFLFVPLLLLCVFTYLPFVKMVGFSFYKMKYIGPRTFVGWDNYIEVFKRPEFSNPCLSAFTIWAGHLFSWRLPCSLPR